MKTKLNKYLKIFFLTLIVVLLFTFFDFLIHGLSPKFAVPDYYFIDKIIFGVIYGFVILLFTQRLKPLKQSLVFSAIISSFLQIRYYLTGYEKWFVFLFLGIHFVILLIVTSIIFTIVKKKKWIK